MKNTHCDSAARTDDCYNGSSSSYMGHVNQTKSGLQCQRWDSNYPHKSYFNHVLNFVDGVVPENYCRSPDNLEPWCYTTDPSKRWEYCNVTKCPGKHTFYLDFNLAVYIWHIYIVYPRCYFHAVNVFVMNLVV